MHAGCQGMFLKPQQASIQEAIHCAVSVVLAFSHQLQMPFEWMHALPCTDCVYYSILFHKQYSILYLTYYIKQLTEVN